MKTSEFRDITYELDADGIVTLTFNTPARKNSLSVYSFYEIYLAIDAFEKDDAAYAMIVTGAVTEEDTPEREAYSSGGYFSHDVLEGLPPEILAELDLSDIAQKRVTMKMFQCEKPIIAAVNGYAIGGAATLTLAGADQIYMSEHAWFQLPFAKLGISAELASSLLMPRLLGMHKAKEIMFFADKIDANKAKELMLANEVVPHDQLLNYAHERAKLLVPPQGAPLSIQAMKRLLKAPLIEAVSEALDRENAELSKLFHTQDFAEGVAARIEKRAAVFKGA